MISNRSNKALVIILAFTACTFFGCRQKSSQSPVQENGMYSAYDSFPNEWRTNKDTILEPSYANQRIEIQYLYPYRFVDQNGYDWYVDVWLWPKDDEIGDVLHWCEAGFRFYHPSDSSGCGREYFFYHIDNYWAPQISGCDTIKGILTVRHTPEYILPEEDKLLSTRSPVYLKDIDGDGIQEWVIPNPIIGTRSGYEFHTFNGDSEEYNKNEYSKVIIRRNDHVRSDNR